MEHISGRLREPRSLVGGGRCANLKPVTRLTTEERIRLYGLLDLRSRQTPDCWQYFQPPGLGDNLGALIVHDLILYPLPSFALASHETRVSNKGLLWLGGRLPYRLLLPRPRLFLRVAEQTSDLAHNRIRRIECSSEQLLAFFHRGGA